MKEFRGTNLVAEFDLELGDLQKSPKQSDSIVGSVEEFD